MEKYAVIRIRGKQYKVKEGDEILVPGTCDEKEGVEILLLVNNGKLLVGKPVIKADLVKFKVVEKNIKGKKVEVLKYKAKSRYRRKMGFRSTATKLLIDKLG